jgi:predicted alpha/beta-hydrolase family hydrolase
MTRTEHRFQASRSAGEVSAIFDRPERARWLYVFGHGAGAGMRHGFMERASAALGSEGIGGKSMGGRMTSLASAAEPLDGVRGLVFFGFPLHPPGKPGTDRSEHLDRVPVPMLFLAGTRDKLANLDLMKPLTERLGERATLHIVEGADHSFAVPKRAGRDLDDVLFELARTTSEWAGRLEGS